MEHAQNAIENQPEAESSPIEQFMTFQLNEESYGVPVQNIQEVHQMMELTPIPNAAYGVIGTLNLRGKIVPVMDLKLQMGLSLTQHTHETCIIFLQDHEQSMGVVVDRVHSVIDLKSSDIEEKPSSMHLDWVNGLGRQEEKVVILLSPERMMQVIK